MAVSPPLGASAGQPPLSWRTTGISNPKYRQRESMGGGRGMWDRLHRPCRPSGPRLTSLWLVLPVPSAARRSISVHRSEHKHVGRPTLRRVGSEVGGRSGGAIRPRGSALRCIVAWFAGCAQRIDFQDLDCGFNCKKCTTGKGILKDDGISSIDCDLVPWFHTLITVIGAAVISSFLFLSGWLMVQLILRLAVCLEFFLSEVFSSVTCCMSSGWLHHQLETLNNTIYVRERYHSLVRKSTRCQKLLWSTWTWYKKRWWLFDFLSWYKLQNTNRFACYFYYYIVYVLIAIPHVVVNSVWRCKSLSWLNKNR
jgi:hypothetical protein